MMFESALGRGISRFFKETPWVAWIILLNLTTWLTEFFHYPQLVNIVYGDLGMEAPWRWLTYPLYTPLEVLWFLVSLYCFYWIASSLERQWGSEKFARVFVVVTLLTAGAVWAGFAVLQMTLEPAASTFGGLILPELALFTIWCALNSDATVLAFMIVPVQAKYLALFSVVVAYFQIGRIGPIFGLFAVSVSIAGWFWGKHSLKAPTHGGARGGRGTRHAIKKKKRDPKKSRFSLLEGKGQGAPGEAPDLREVEREAKAKQKSEEAAELDRILDKIRFEGMSALSPQEKETLDKHSRKLQDES